MQDNLVIMGINSPKEHQAVITRLIHGLADLYLRDNTKLFPYPDTMIDESQTSPAPDILPYDHDREKTMVIIEVTHSAGAKRDAEKVRRLMMDYEVAEGFVYDYKKRIWQRFEEHHEQPSPGSLSTILGIDLAAFLAR